MTIVPLVAGYFAIQWNRGNFLGKSPEQIVAMGREKWTELYGKKVGESTQQMSAAQEKYGIALGNLNDRTIRTLPHAQQIWLKEVRQHTKEYAVEAHQIGEIVAGGGTIWQNFNSTILPDVEQTIADCIVRKPIPVTKMKSFEVHLQELDKVISHFNVDSDNGTSQYQELVKHRTDLAKRQTTLMGLLAKGRANDSTRIQIYMHRKIDVAKDGDMS